MPFQRPTLREIQDRQLADLQSSLGTGPLVRNSFIGALVRSIAGAVHLLYGFLVWITKQALPDTAEGEYLNRWASIWGVNRSAATFAQGEVIFTGTNGTVVPAGTIIQNSAGLQYTTDESVEIATEVGQVAVTASFAGIDSNAAEDDILSMLSPVSGVNSNATVAAGGIGGGADQETDDSLREQLLNRIQDPPQGGSKADYKQWALEVSGVARAFIFPEKDGPGTVGVGILGPDDAIPDDTLVELVQEYIDDEERRPVTANVTVFAPSTDALDFTIRVTPDTADIRTSVENSLQAMLKRDAQPGGIIYLSRIQEAVSIAAGESDSEVQVPTTDTEYEPEVMPIFGTVTWI